MSKKEHEDTLNDMMIGIEEIIGDKINWAIDNQEYYGEIVILDKENLSIILKAMDELFYKKD